MDDNGFHVATSSFSTPFELSSALDTAAAALPLLIRFRAVHSRRWSVHSIPLRNLREQSHTKGSDEGGGGGGEGDDTLDRRGAAELRDAAAAEEAARATGWSSTISSSSCEAAACGSSSSSVSFSLSDAESLSYFVRLRDDPPSSEESLPSSPATTGHNDKKVNAPSHKHTQKYNKFLRQVTKFPVPRTSDKRLVVHVCVVLTF